MAKPTEAISEGPSHISTGRRQWPPPTPTSPCFQLLSPWCSLTLCPAKGLPELEFFLCYLPECRSHTAANTTGRSLGISLVPSLGRAMLLPRSHHGGILAAAQSRAERVGSRLKVAKISTPVVCFHIKQRIETTTSDAWQEKKRAECRILPSLDSI